MITTEFLDNISNIVKITQLANEAKLNYQTLISKIREKRDLTTTESKKIEIVLKNYHLYSPALEEFNIEKYKHLSSEEIMELDDEYIKGKILEYYSGEYAKSFELIEGDLEVYDY